MSTMQASLFELPQAPPTPHRFGRAFVRAIEAKSILTTANGKISGFTYSLNPYRGCGFGCSYCYAAFFVPDDVRRDAWGQWVEVKKNALELLGKQKDLGGARILMSSVTDPYQPIEMKTELTRSLLEHLAGRRDQPRMVIQTRSPLVTRDIDILKRFKDVRVNMSVTTDSDEIRKRFEPGCASIERRLEALRELRDAGIRTCVCISPMLPIEDPIQFARTLRELKAESYWTAWFHSSNKLFSSNTGKEAVRIAKEMNWTKSKFDRAKATLQTLIPQFAD